MDKETYEILSAPFKATEARSLAFCRASKALELLFYISYPLLLLYLFLLGPVEGDSFPLNRQLIPCIIIPFAGFLLVSWLRKLINAPRPYEVLDIDPLIKKDTKGCSLPSKHTYSSFIIAFCWLSACGWIGAAFLLAAICIAVMRVIGGVHFPRDVISAFAIAAALGCLLLIW